MKRYAPELEPLEPRLLFTAVPLITEFVASNADGLVDEDGDSSDWIELYNAGDTALDLDGWHLTDDAGNLAQWTFPSVSIDPGEYLVVFASDKDRADSDGTELHTNFKISAGGEYLALVEADGSTVAHAFAPVFPPQSTDVSYGLRMNVAETTLIAEGAAAQYLIPSATVAGWNTPGFNDTGWSVGDTGIGYETSPADFAGLIETPVPNGTRSVYLRQDFHVDDPSTFNTLTLGLRYDDGFVAYLNGERVAERFAPASPAWNSFAVGVQNHPDSEAAELEPFDLSAHLGDLVAGNNVLAIQVMNADAGSSDLLIEPVLTAGVTSVDAGITAFMTAPTPGAVNVMSGPLITSVTRNPPQPLATQDLVVEAAVAANAGNGVGRVDLYTRVGYGAEGVVQMFDNGLGLDATAGDGVYTAGIDHALYSAGDMVRWYVTAEDDQGTVSRAPIFADQSGNNQSAEYFGTVVADPSVTSHLPIYHWFTSDPNTARSPSGTRASVFYNGEFYDNVYVRQRGQSSNAFTSKKSLKFDFNTGDRFRFDPEHPRVDEVNLNNTYFDKSYVRQPLAWETFEAAGSPYSISFPMRLQLNGGFYSVQIFVEQVDERYLVRNGLDPDGALYKARQAGNYLKSGSVANLDKQTRLHEDTADVQALVDGINPSNPQNEREVYVFDHIDIPATINYLAVMSLLHGNDHVQKNYYLYRDTEGTGEWTFLPWDLDLSLGKNFASRDDTIFSDELPGGHPLWGSSDYPRASGSGQWNGLIDAVLDTPEVREMYLRRLRTLMDNILQAPGTPAGQLQYETRLDELFNATSQDVALDDIAWNEEWGTNFTHQQNIDRIKDLYLAARRVHLFQTHNIDNLPGIGEADPDEVAGIPDAQPAAPALNIGGLDFAPVSGENDEEYIQLINPNAFAIDISGWTVEGAITHTFRPGTVIAAGQSLYITAKSSAFRARATGPTGGQGLFVQQWDSGQLSAFGETITIKRADGSTATQLTYDGTDPGDITGDGYVGIEDLDQLLIYWGDAAGSSAGALAADLNQDGAVNTPDLDIVLDNFGKGTPASNQPTSDPAPGSDSGSDPGGPTFVASAGARSVGDQPITPPVDLGIDTPGTDAEGDGGVADREAIAGSGTDKAGQDPATPTRPKRPIVEPEFQARAMTPVPPDLPGGRERPPAAGSRPARAIKPGASTTIQPAPSQTLTPQPTRDARLAAVMWTGVDVLALARVVKDDPAPPRTAPDTDAPRRRFDALAPQN